MADDKKGVVGTPQRTVPDVSGISGQHAVSSKAFYEAMLTDGFAA